MLELATSGATVKELLEEVKKNDSDSDNIEDDEIEAKTAETIQFSLCANKIFNKIRS